MKKSGNKKGFTLVEIIVVLLVIGILLAITIPSIMGYVKKAKQAQLIAEARTILMIAERQSYNYYNNNFKDNVSNANGIKKLSNQDIDQFIANIKSEYNESNYPIVDIIIYYDDIEPRDYTYVDKNNTTTVSKLAYSIKSTSSNHFISKIAVGFGEGDTFPDNYVVIRTNEEARYFEFLELYKESIDSDWNCQPNL